MWECPKCGRKFKNTNQSHYCGNAPQNIEEYIAQQPENVRPYLHQINDAIKTHCRTLFKKFHGVCRLIGKNGTSSSLRHLKNTLVCIPALRRWKPLQTGCKDIKPAKEPSGSPMTSRCRLI